MIRKKNSDMDEDILTILIKRLFEILDLEYYRNHSLEENLKNTSQSIKKIFEIELSDDVTQVKYFEYTKLVDADEIVEKLKYNFPDNLLYFELSALIHYWYIRYFKTIGNFRFSNTFNYAFEDISRCIELSDGIVYQLFMIRIFNLDIARGYGSKWQELKNKYPESAELYIELLPEVVHRYNRHFRKHKNSNSNHTSEDLEDSYRQMKYLQGEYFSNIENALKINPYFEKAYFALAKGILLFEKYEDQFLNNMEALENYNKAIFIDSNYQEAYFKRAKLYIILGKNKEAFKDFESALKIKLSEIICLTYAREKEELGFTNDALEIMSRLKVLYLEPSCAFRAKLNEKLGNYSQAHKDYVDAIVYHDMYGSDEALEGRKRVVKILKEQGKYDIAIDEYYYQAQNRFS